MVNHYKKSLLDYLNLLHQARKQPMKNPQKWKILQEKLVQRLFYIGRKIREKKDEVNAIHQLRKNSERRLTKEQSVSAKDRISYLEDQIDEYHWLIDGFKSIGDGIAYTFISRYDLKP